MRVWVLTASPVLLQFDPARPGQILRQVPRQGQAQGEVIVGVDDRVARGRLHALSSQGHLHTLDPAQGRLQRLGTGEPVRALAIEP